MMIAITLVSMAVGCILGYNVGYSRCHYQFSRALEVVKQAALKTQRKEI